MIESLADSDSDSDVDVPDEVGQLAEQFLALHRQGLTPNIDDYCLRYPEFADRIRSLFPTLLMVEQCGVAASGDSFIIKSGLVGATCPEQIGDYKIIREVGRGGMGIVYEAEQQSLGRRVALKVLPTSAVLSKSTIERFRRESRAAAKLHHSNIVPVFGVGEQDGLHYYVMQFIQGVGLDEILLQLADSKRDLLFQGTETHPNDTQASETSTDSSKLAARTLSSSDGEKQPSGSEDRIYWHRVALIGMQLANALHFAHSQGVLHRDLKPANVLLDMDGTVWLTDFGLAQATDDSNLTRSGDIVGTLRYLAPERLRGECSRQSDVYGLGITLYELVTFAPAFAENDRATLIRQIVQQDPKRPRSINHNVPRDLETIILKAIEKEATRRYESAEALADDLSRFLGDRPIRARRVVWVEQAWRWCRRNPMVATLSSVVCLLMLGLTFAWGMFSWVRNDRDRARTAEIRAEQARAVANREEAIAQSRSHLARAIGYRHGTEPGRKTKVLSEISQALTFAPPESIRFDLRNEAIAALAQTDVSLGRIWNDGQMNANLVRFDQEMKRFARLEDSGIVSIIQVENNQLIGQFFPKAVGLRAALLSDRGHFLILAEKEGGSIEVWDALRNELVVGPVAEYWTFDITTDESKFAVSKVDGTIDVYDLSSGKKDRQLVLEGVATVLSYSPDNSQLAIVHSKKPTVLRIVETTSGSELELSMENPIYVCQWHPDGNRLAIGVGGNVEVWDTRMRRKLATMAGHAQQITAVSFNKPGDCITSSSWDGTMRVWETATGNQIALFTGSGLNLNGNKSVVGLRLIEGRLQTVELDRPVGFDRLANGNAIELSKYHCGVTSPDGRLLIAGTEAGLEFWDLAERNKIASIKEAFTKQLFFDSTRGQLTCMTMSQGIHQVPIQFDGRLCRVGNSVPLGKESFSVNQSDATITPDGQLLGTIGNSKATLRLASGELLREFAVESKHNNLCLSPDKKMLVTYGWHSPIVTVWDIGTGKLLKQLTYTQTIHTFTPDSKQLITCTGGEYIFRNIADWTITRRIERRDCAFPSSIAYASSGDLIALELTWGVIHLLRADTFETVAMLESPIKNRSTQFGFIGADNTLIVFQHLAGEMHIWRINELSDRLNQMGLGWQDESQVAANVNRGPIRIGPTTKGSIELVSQLSEDPSDLETVRHWIAMDEQQLNNEPDSMLAVNNLAWRLVNAPAELRDVNRAVLLLEKAIEIEPLDENTRNTLAIAYYRTGRFAEAAALLRVNLDVTTDAYIGFDLYFLSMCYWQLNEQEHSRETLEWAERMFRLKLPPDIKSLRELEAFQQEARELIQKGNSRE